MSHAFVVACTDFCSTHPLASAIILAVLGGAGMWIVAILLYVDMPGRKPASVDRLHTSDPCWCPRFHPALNEPELARGQGAVRAMPVFERGTTENQPRPGHNRVDPDRVPRGKPDETLIPSSEDHTREGRKSIQPSEPWPEPGATGG